jgi:hypothetical protein
MMTMTWPGELGHSIRNIFHYPTFIHSLFILFIFSFHFRSPSWPADEVNLVLKHKTTKRKPDVSGSSQQLTRE